MKPILFYFFSSITLLSAVGVITLPKPARALISLLAVMFSLTVLYLLLGAPFLAMANLIVYAGAVLVLFLFVIMLQGIETKDVPFSKRFAPWYFALTGFVGSAFLAIMLFLFLKTFVFSAPQGILGNVEAIAAPLFRNYLIPFELTSLLLLMGVFAAVGLAKKDPE